MKKTILLLCTMALILAARAQEKEELQRRNTIKIDLTSHLIYRNAMIFSYERVTKPNQSFVVTVGYQEFPRTSSLGSNIGVKADNKRYGLKFGGDYRFYLAKENKYRAPHGIYIGPYFMFHKFSNERLLEVDNNGNPEEVILNSSLGIFNVGFQLGYQFIINNRWAIDLVFVGPSVSNYRFKLDLDGTYTFDTDDVQNEIMKNLIERFPLLEDAIDDTEANASGKLDTWSFGYRYQLQIGYHFGRKK